MALVGCLIFCASTVDAAKTQSAYASQVAQLHATAHLLNQADHDYQGHRAKAVHEIHQAIHALHPGPHKRHPHAPKKTGNNEPQSVSDAQLNQAIAQLKTVQGQLSGAPPHALTAIQSSIQQLETALKIK